MKRTAMRRLYYREVADLLQDPQVRRMRNFPQHGRTTCLAHCLAVSYMGFSVCYRLGLNARAAARGGLLHDFYLYDWHKENPYPGLHGFTHPQTALQNASRRFAITPLEAEIIATHMWPLTLRHMPRHGESLAIAVADKVCALRETLRRPVKKKKSRDVRDPGNRSTPGEL